MTDAIEYSDDVAAGPDLADALTQLWEQGHQPNVDVFLACQGALSPAERIELLLVDQTNRWRMGERIKAEEYLARHPDLQMQEESFIDLIYHEFLERESLGEAPTSEEYARRFPSYATTLRAQIDFHRALQAAIESDARRETGFRLAAPQRRPNREFENILAPMHSPLDAGATPVQDSQLPELLRRRLRMVFYVLASWFGASTLATLIYVYVLGGRPFAIFGQNNALNIGIVIIVSVTAGLLGSKRSLSLGQLRGIEYILLILGAMLCTYRQSIFLEGGLFPRSGTDAASITLASYHALPWFSLLTAYGLFIPNTRNRCAILVGVTACCPIVVFLIDALHPTGWPQGTLVYMYVIWLGSWMLFGVGLALFGSHQLVMLREQAWAGRRLGQYRLQHRIGSGGMGDVYLADHMLLKRPCAIKVIRPDRAYNESELTRFEREVKATAKLVHPNTVHVYDYGRSQEGAFYYAMEYLPGMNLHELVDIHGRLPPNRVIHFLRQICGALHEAHGIGLIHRDIKPANVMIGQWGGLSDVAKLLDFGLVRSSVEEAATQLTMNGVIVGTPAFMSPEQAEGRLDLDQRSDIYSLGALAYYLLAGQPPFSGRTAIGVLVAHQRESPEPLSHHCADVPAALESGVMRCLAKNPNDRYPNVLALDQELILCVKYDCDLWTDAAAEKWWDAIHAARDDRRDLAERPSSADSLPPSKADVGQLEAQPD